MAPAQKPPVIQGFFWIGLALAALVGAVRLFAAAQAAPTPLLSPTASPTARASQPPRLVFLESLTLIQPPAQAEQPFSTAEIRLETAFYGPDAATCCGAGTAAPPDPALAAGLNHILAATNVSFEVFNKQGQILAGPVLFSQFFAPLGGVNCPSGGATQPNARYDEAADRFLLGANGSGQAYCLAVSQTGDPTGGWYLYEFPVGGNGLLFDSPRAGIGREAVYLGANLYSGSTFAEGRVWAFDKTSLYQGLPAAYTSKSLGASRSPQPLHLYGYAYGRWPTAGPHAFLAAEGVDGQVYSLYTWTNPWGQNLLETRAVLDIPAAHGQVTGPPVNAPQNGGSDIRPTGNGPGEFSFQDGMGWAAMTVGCGAVNCIQWAQIDLEAGEIVQAGLLASAEEHRFVPAVAANQCGDAIVVYTKSSSAMVPAAWAAGRQAADPPGSLLAEFLFKAGETPYVGLDAPPYRWGQTAGMALDPDGLVFWSLVEYSKDTSRSDNRWGTYAAALSFPTCSGEPGFTLAANPTTASTCLGETAFFTAALGQSGGFSETVNLALQGLPEAGAYGFSPSELAPPGSSLLQIETATLNQGLYPLTITAAAPSITQAVPITLVVAAPLGPAPTLTSPGLGAANVDFSTAFTWEALPGASGYRLELANQPDFETMLFSQETTQTTLQPGIQFTPGEMVFWRVIAQNGCGSVSSALGFFQAAHGFCQASPVTIPDNGQASSEQTITLEGTLAGLDVYLEASHTYVGDLIFDLKHLQSGTSVRLLDRPGLPASAWGCSGDNIAAWLDDQAAAPVEQACSPTPPAIAGRLAPEQPLETFQGLPLQGGWALSLGDAAAGDTGRLEQWCILPELEPAPFTHTPAEIEMTLYAGQSHTTTLEIANQGSTAVAWTLAASGDGCASAPGLSWLGLPQTRGSLSPGEAASLPVRLATTGLAPGDYTGGLCLFSAPSQAPVVEISVRLQVLEMARLQGQIALQGCAACTYSESVIYIMNHYDTIPIIMYSSAEGWYSASLLAGVYTVRVEMPLALDAEITGVSLSAGQVLTLPPVTLLAGDANDDDVINLDDLQTIAGQFGLTGGMPGFDGRADFNQDGVVNLQDAALAAGNFGKTSGVDVPWEPEGP